MSLFAALRLKKGLPPTEEEEEEVNVPSQKINTVPIVAKVVRPRPDAEKTVRIVCISDTHNLHERIEVPDGDILVHAGDFSRGSFKSIKSFSDWLGRLPHKHKIVVAGNHDSLFEMDPPKARATLENVIFLSDSGVTVEGLKFWGCPLPPLLKGLALTRKWEKIPSDTDILITHHPPFGFGDILLSTGEHAGCPVLLETVQKRVIPRVHIFGHFHEGAGIFYDENTTYINASTLTKAMEPSNPPILFDI